MDFWYIWKEPLEKEFSFAMCLVQATSTTVLLLRQLFTDAREPSALLLPYESPVMTIRRDGTANNLWFAGLASGHVDEPSLIGSRCDDAVAGGPKGTLADSRRTLHCMYAWPAMPLPATTLLLLPVHIYIYIYMQI